MKAEQEDAEEGDERADVIRPVPLANAQTQIVRSSATESKSATPDMSEGEYVPCVVLCLFSLDYVLPLCASA